MFCKVKVNNVFEENAGARRDQTEIPAGSTIGDVTKYVYVDNALFHIDEKQSTMTEIEKADTLDLYFSFSDLTEKYDKK